MNLSQFFKRIAHAIDATLAAPFEFGHRMLNPKYKAPARRPARKAP